MVSHNQVFILENHSDNQVGEEGGYLMLPLVLIEHK